MLKTRWLSTDIFEEDSAIISQSCKPGKKKTSTCGPSLWCKMEPLDRRKKKGGGKNVCVEFFQPLSELKVNPLVCDALTFTFTATFYMHTSDVQP